MGEELQQEPRNIMLPASVLDALRDLPAGALKVLIYLCSRNQGQPFAATIPTITDATGIQPRSVIAALKTLEEQKLITRIPGSGNQPNQYGIPFPKRQETAPPSPELRLAPPPAAPGPRRSISGLAERYARGTDRSAFLRRCFRLGRASRAHYLRRRLSGSGTAGRPAARQSRRQAAQGRRQVRRASVRTTRIAPIPALLPPPDLAPAPDARRAAGS